MDPQAGGAGGDLKGTEPLEQLVIGVGTPDFTGALLAHGWTRLRASHLSMIRFDAALEPTVTLSASLDGSDTAARAASVYRRSLLHRQDPLFSTVAERRETRPAVTRMRLADMADADHRRLIYESFGLSERFAILGCQKGVWSALNFYRDDGAPAPQDIAGLVEEAGLLHALATRHLSLTHDAGVLPEEATLARLLARLRPRLTGRQIEVCSRALCGLTNPEIAADLGIGASTVSTLRRRAYERLGVASLAELFRRCLAVAAG